MGQAVAAQLLERRWRKDQILEAYLNLVPFRGELVGIDALSRTLFAKAAHGLDAREAAVAAALVRAPNARPAVVAQRACSVLRAMAHSAPDCLALDMFASAALQRRAYAASEGIAPHFARWRLAREYPPGTPAAQLPSTLRTTLRASQGQQRLIFVSGKDTIQVLHDHGKTGVIMALLLWQHQAQRRGWLNGYLALD